MEDKIYTTSTQYRLFTYTPQQLSDLRHATNRAAAEKITASIKAARAAAGDDADSDAAAAAAAADEEEIDCPTAEEELKLVAYYCVKCMQLSDHFKFPSAVKATALTFLHRLYLTTSTLTLHPKKLLLPILYLATKTENYYTPIDRFIATALTAGTTITKDDLISPEFKIAMGLRWAFQIWHPFRGLEGIFLELNAMHQGTYASPQHAPGEAADAKRRLEELAAAAPAAAGGGAAEAVVARIGRAHGEARAILTSTALLTDVYFLYTPPQISFAAFLQADRELAEMYLDVKFPAGGAAAEATKRKLLKVVGECAERHLAGGITRDSPNPYPGLCLQLPQNGVATSVLASLDKGLVKEVTRVDKKLYHVTNRDKKANGCGAGKKEREREGNYEASAVEEERKAKKRRLEREKLARDGDVFGGVLHQAQE